MQQKYAKKYAINMQNMHKSMYWHILHICALPTLLMLLVLNLPVESLQTVQSSDSEPCLQCLSQLLTWSNSSSHCRAGSVAWASTFMLKLVPGLLGPVVVRSSGTATRPCRGPSGQSEGY